LQAVTKSLNNAHRALMHEVLHLQNMLPPAMTWEQLVERAAMGQNGALQVLSSLHDHQLQCVALSLCFQDARCRNLRDQMGRRVT